MPRQCCIECDRVISRLSLFNINAWNLICRSFSRLPGYPEILRKSDAGDSFHDQFGGRTFSLIVHPIFLRLQECAQFLDILGKHSGELNPVADLRITRDDLGQNQQRAVHFQLELQSRADG